MPDGVSAIYDGACAACKAWSANGPSQAAITDPGRWRVLHTHAQARAPSEMTTAAAVRPVVAACALLLGSRRRRRRRRRQQEKQQQHDCAEDAGAREREPMPPSPPAAAAPVRTYLRIPSWNFQKPIGAPGMSNGVSNPHFPCRPARHRMHSTAQHSTPARNPNRLRSAFLRQSVPAGAVVGHLPSSGHTNRGELIFYLRLFSCKRHLAAGTPWLFLKGVGWLPCQPTSSGHTLVDCSWRGLGGCPVSQLHAACLQKRSVAVRVSVPTATHLCFMRAED